ncbi:MFS transporter [Bacillus sp. CGMCC 1.16607]|uniref:MFS transporter n=1 Tax=Bacillus sp. CGMCC 1.16607 TaxID=3351842 RepID=UPI003627D8F5
MKQEGGLKVLLLTCIGIFICMLDSTIMNITLPAIQDDLSTSLETSSWMLNIYTMTIAVLAIPMARFAEMFGRNKFYILGLFIFGVGSALCGLATSGDFLIAARFIQSIGASILIPCSMIIGIAAMPIEKRVLPLTLLGATQGLATAMGPSVGGLITEKLSWHWVFYVNVPICLLAIFACGFVLVLKNEARIRSSIDWFGLVFSVLAIFSMNLVLIKGNSWGWKSGSAILCFVIFVVAVLLFIFTESKVKNPMVNLNLFKDRVFTGSVITVSTGFIFFIGVMVLLPQFLTMFQHKTELEAALLITPASAAIFVFANFAGLLAKKVGFTIPVILGFGIMSIAYFLLREIDIQSTSLEIIIICALLGLGFSFIISASTIASTSSFEGEMLTASQSVFSMIRQVGVVLAVAIFIAGLTNNIDAKKQQVTHYAEDQITKLDIPDETKELVLLKTKDVMKNSTTKSTAASSILVTEAERKQIIDQNVQKALVSIPEGQRNQALSMVQQKVEKQVDEEIAKNSSLVQNYSKNVSTYAESTISSSFADLYKKSIPFVLLCSLTGIVFIKRKRGMVPTIKQEIAN